MKTRLCARGGFLDRGAVAFSLRARFGVDFSFRDIFDADARTRGPHRHRRGGLQRLLAGDIPTDSRARCHGSNKDHFLSTIDRIGQASRVDGALSGPLTLIPEASTPRSASATKR